MLTKATEFTLKYQSRNNDQWNAYQRSLGELTKNAQIYLGDFLLFLLFWITLFNVTPQTPWVAANEARFWPVALVLSGLAWFAWFRVSRAVDVVPALQLMYVSTMLRADSDMRVALEVPDEERDKVRRRLEELMATAQEREDSRPSMLNVLRYKVGVLRTAREDENRKRDRGFPFPSLYERGLRFSWDREWHAQYDKHWLAGYFAYTYYRLHRRLVQLARALWQLGRYVVTGAP